MIWLNAINNGLLPPHGLEGLLAAIDDDPVLALTIDATIPKRLESLLDDYLLRVAGTISTELASAWTDAPVYINEAKTMLPRPEF